VCKNQDILIFPNFEWFSWQNLSSVGRNGLTWYYPTLKHLEFHISGLLLLYNTRYPRWEVNFQLQRYPVIHHCTTAGFWHTYLLISHWNKNSLHIVEWILAQATSTIHRSVRTDTVQTFSCVSQLSEYFVTKSVYHNRLQCCIQGR